MTRMANFVWVSARFLTYKIYLRQFCSSSPEAMPPKSKVQPSNPVRVTRSQRAPPTSPTPRATNSEESSEFRHLYI